MQIASVSDRCYRLPMVDTSAKLNLIDVARAAGVSLATASRALSGAYGVAATTRARVLAAAEEMSYVASPEAARLAGGATGRVAVVVPHISRWFFGTMLEALDSVLRDADLDVLLYHVGGLDDRREFFERLPARRKVDAVVVVAFPVEEAERQRLALMGVQIVAAGGQNAVYPYVCIDDAAAARQAMAHLLFLGHRRIAMIEAIDPDQPTRPSGRSSGYYAALREAGIEPDPDLVVTTDWGGEQGAQAMSRLLSIAHPPTAVYAHSDEVAIGAIRTIRRSGLRVPDDISIVGIDDHPLASLTDLTTVRQPVHEQGTTAAHLLLAMLRGEADVERAVVLPTELVVRRSTAPPRPDRRTG